MTEIPVLWKRVEIAAIVDGFSRKTVAMKAFSMRPTSDDLMQLVTEAIETNGPVLRFLVTDHGSQFRSGFHSSIGAIGVTHIRCQVRTWQLNAKVERLFRDVKAWRRRTTLPLGTNAVQQRLDAYRDWHNRFRPHTAHGTLTPVEAERGDQAI